jgi:uncharacterized protein
MVSFDRLDDRIDVLNSGRAIDRSQNSPAHPAGRHLRKCRQVMSDTISTPQSTAKVRAASQQTFRDQLGHLAAGRSAEWGELFTEDAVLEFPYAPKGYPTQVVGREKLREHLEGFSKIFNVEFIDLVFHETVDPSLVIAQVKSKGVVLESNRRYDQSYICVVTTEAGKMNRYVDFWNPQVLLDALGGETDDLVAAVVTG